MGKLLALFVGVRPISLLPTAFSTQQESKLHLLSTGKTPECVSWTSFRGSRCPVSRLSWSTAPMFSKSTKKLSSLVSPTQTSRNYWQRHVPAEGMSSCSRARAVVAALVSLLFWTGSYCISGYEPSLCPAAKGFFLASVLHIRACAPDDVSPLDFSEPCAHVPFLWRPNLAPGLDGCFHQDRIHCNKNVNSPDILRSTRRWKALILRASSLPAQEALLRAATFWRRSCAFLPGTLAAYWVLPHRVRDRGKN